MVQGYVGAEPFAGDEHSWVEFDGEVIDPTIRQFRWWRSDIQIRRKVVARMPAAEAKDWFETIIGCDSPQGVFYREIMNARRRAARKAKQ